MRDQAIFNLYPSAVTVGNDGKFVLDKDIVQTEPSLDQVR